VHTIPIARHIIQQGFTTSWANFCVYPIAGFPAMAFPMHHWWHHLELSRVGFSQLIYCIVSEYNHYNCCGNWPNWPRSVSGAAVSRRSSDGNVWQQYMTRSSSLLSDRRSFCDVSTLHSYNNIGTNLRSRQRSVNSEFNLWLWLWVWLRAQQCLYLV